MSEAAKPADIAILRGTDRVTADRRRGKYITAGREARPLAASFARMRCDLARREIQAFAQADRAAIGMP